MSQRIDHSFAVITCTCFLSTVHAPCAGPIECLIYVVKSYRNLSFSITYFGFPDNVPTDFGSSAFVLPTAAHHVNMSSQIAKLLVLASASPYD